MLKTLLRGLVLTVAVSLFLAGIIWLGRNTVEQLRGQDRYHIHFADIQCKPPAGMSREDFLDEVRYLTSMPPALPLLDEQLSGRLSQAFALHPWVEKVDRVLILPNHEVRIQLKFRIAVLAVPWDGRMRAVDAAGVLLPVDAATDDLPVFDGIALPPTGPAGTAWDDPSVIEAARRAALAATPSSR